MKSLTIALLGLGFCTHAVSQADDPCKVAGINGSFALNSMQGGGYVPICVLGGGLQMAGVDSHLATQQVIALRAINSQMNDMKTTIGSLKDAIDNLNKTTNNLSAANTKWRADTLDAAIKSINAIPSELAGNADLKEALKKAVADALLNDQQFVQQVQTAKK
jgi:hypothetical protein